MRLAQKHVGEELKMMILYPALDFKMIVDNVGPL